MSINANFVIYRSDENKNFLNWEECYYFSINSSIIDYVWKDYTVEHKKKYKYAIAQYNNNGLYSEKVIGTIPDSTEEIINLDFEDIFLYDGLKILKVKFNPKIASFKNNNLDTKIETIGKQHPYILRHGAVSYKEFPISGLISYLMDADNIFLNNNLSKITR
jgi:hypothetical protein